MASLWLAGEVVNHVGKYGSRAVEGLSAFQRRSCLISYNGKPQSVLEGRVFRASKVAIKGIKAIKNEQNRFYKTGLKFIRQTDLAYIVVW